MKTVCFVRREASIRVYKQAKALKKGKRYRTVLLCEKCDQSLFGDVFDEILFYNFTGSKNKSLIYRAVNYGLNRTLGYAEKNLAKKVRSIEADIFHAHAEPNSVPRIVMGHSGRPVVFDAQDFSGISYGIENLDQGTREDERYCFEHAAGICHKASPFEIDYYRQHGYSIKSPEIQWMDYCDADLFADPSTRKLSEDDGELHFVHTGTVSNDPKYRYKYLIPLGKALAKQGMHLHIYPANAYEYRTYKEYHAMARTEKRFHFHAPVQYILLNKEIAKYDWHSHILENYAGPMFTPEKQRVSMGNKLFTALEAGLPMVVSSHLECVRELTENHKIGFAIKDEELPRLKEMMARCDYGDFKKNVLKARETLSLRNQVRRLEDFYGEVERWYGKKQ